MTICKGCGVTLQHTNPNEPGYTPKEDGVYCQRCFRIMHYDDLVFSLRDTISPSQIIKQIESQEGVILWIVDLFDFESSIPVSSSPKLVLVRHSSALLRTQLNAVCGLVTSFLSKGSL